MSDYLRIYISVQIFIQAILHTAILVAYLLRKFL